jgi:pheromone shutdown protein TraB
MTELSEVVNNDGKTNPEIKRMMYNVVVISLSFTLLFTAYQSTANLQSSLNMEQGLGTASLSTVYATLILSCLFVPTYMISKLTVKWTISVSMLGYAAYIAAQFAASWYTLIPTAALVGISAAPLWSAKCTYLTHIGTVKAKAEDKSPVPQVTRLFGIFFMLFQCSQVFGNLISSTGSYHI